MNVKVKVKVNKELTEITGYVDDCIVVMVSKSSDKWAIKLLHSLDVDKERFKKLVECYGEVAAEMDLIDTRPNTESMFDMPVPWLVADKG